MVHIPNTIKLDRFNQLIDFLHFLTERRKSVEEKIHQKKNRSHRTSKIVKSRQSERPYWESEIILLWGILGENTIS